MPIVIRRVFAKDFHGRVGTDIGALTAPPALIFALDFNVWLAARVQLSRRSYQPARTCFNTQPASLTALFVDTNYVLLLRHSGTLRPTGVDCQR